MIHTVDYLSIAIPSRKYLQEIILLLYFLSSKFSIRFFKVFNTQQTVLKGSTDLLRNTMFILLAVLALSSFVLAQPTGDPNHEGRLEFTYSGMGYMAKIDGESLDATNGMKAIMALSHGKHHLQIYKIKGMFSADLVREEKLFIPGGYIVRATLSTEGKLDVYDHVPIPGLNINPPQPEAVPPVPESTTSTTTTTVTSSTGLPSESVSFSIGVGNESISTSMTMPGISTGMAVSEQTTVTTTTTGSMTTPPPQPVAPVIQNRPSRIVLMSEKGMADVYLDGEEKGDLPLAMIDEMSKLTIWDINPGSYLLKVEGFEVWYSGTIKVGSGEEIKIKVEPNEFKIIGRNPLP